MRLQVVLACLATVSFAACGGGGGGGGDSGDDGVDGGGSNHPIDAYVPPQANCAPLDLGNAAAIPIMSGTVTPNPQGGTVASATFKLTSIKLDAGGLPVTGTAKARVEIVAGDATTGAARVAVSLDATAAGQALMQDVTAAGLYTITANSLTVADGCGTGGDPLPALQYTDASTLTLWTTYTAMTDFGNLPIPLELVFAKE